MYKCNKDDPNNARNEETENRSMQISMRSPFKVTVAGNPTAEIIIPKSRNINQ